MRHKLLVLLLHLQRVHGQPIESLNQVCGVGRIGQPRQLGGRFCRLQNRPGLREQRFSRLLVCLNAEGVIRDVEKPALV